MLYRAELRRVLTSLVFWIAAAAILLFMNTQGVFPPASRVERPVPGGSYGVKPSGDPILIMPQAANGLYGEYVANDYTTYPNGLIKRVRLNREDRAAMREILAELSAEELPQLPEDAGGVSSGAGNAVRIDGTQLQSLDGDAYAIIGGQSGTAAIRLNPDITWDRFAILMAQADDLLGGGSDYGVTWMSHRFGEIPITYEEALADYEKAVSVDRITGAHARLFCDYAGIILGLIPVFPAVFLGMRDRRTIAPMLYTRRASSLRLIGARYAALMTAIMLPILVLCALLTVMHGLDYGFAQIDLFAYFRYALLWLLPTAMVSTAVGLFFTTLTGTPIAIAAQLLWWFMDAMGGTGAYSFRGARPLQLAPRHNALGDTQAFLDNLPDLVRNRIGIALIAIALVGGAVAVYAVRRRGCLHVPVRNARGVQSAI